MLCQFVFSDKNEQTQIKVDSTVLHGGFLTLIVTRASFLKTSTCKFLFGIIHRTVLCRGASLPWTVTYVCVSDAPSEPDRSSPVRRIVSFPLTLRIDAQMAPLVRLLVYHVRDGDETIADSIEVQMAFSTQKRVSRYLHIPVKCSSYFFSLVTFTYYVVGVYM